MGAVVLILVALGVLMVAAKFWRKKRKRDGLTAKYGDVGIAKRIMTRQVWEGMTREQLLDSWGNPADIDERVLKKKVTHTYKYHRTGKNRFKSRVTLDNDVVSGWQKR